MRLVHGGIGFAAVRIALGGGCRKRTGMTFTGLLGAGAPGAYFGAVAAGFLGVVTEQVRDAAVIPGLVVLGAVGGLLAAMLTRWAPAVRRRVPVFTAVGLISLPLAMCIGQLPEQWAEVAVGFMAVGWLIRAGRYVSWGRRGRVRRPEAGLAVPVR